MCGFSPGVRGSLMAEIYVKILQHLACILSYLFVLWWLLFKGMFKGSTVGMFVSKYVTLFLLGELGQPLESSFSGCNQDRQVSPTNGSFTNLSLKLVPVLCVCVSLSDEIKPFLVDD